MNSRCGQLNRADFAENERFVAGILYGNGIKSFFWDKKQLPVLCQRPNAQHFSIFEQKSARVGKKVFFDLFSPTI